MNNKFIISIGKAIGINFLINFLIDFLIDIIILIYKYFINCEQILNNQLIL